MKLHLTPSVSIAAVAAIAAASTAVLSAPANAAPKLALVAQSSDGKVFDFDEYAAGDITVQVTRAKNGAPYDIDDATDLKYYWTVTPFDTTQEPVRVPSSGSSVADTDVAGLFDVDLPAGAPSGRYDLYAGIDKTRTKLLTVRAGQATLAFDEGPSLWAEAGTDLAVTGSLTLENGSPLRSRLVELELTQGSAGTDPQADAALLTESGPASLAQVTTTRTGSFEVTLSDPVEEGQGTELGGHLTATSVADPLVGDPGAVADLDVDLVSVQAPAGSTLAVPALGDGTPGTVLASTVTVLAPDDTFDTDPVTPGVQGDADTDPDPVIGQVIDLGVDHGFFTTGEALPTVVGQPAGNLVDAGTAYAVLTDADGATEVSVGIGRDTGFDVNGTLTATVSAQAGALQASAAANWDTVNPLNGVVSIELSPRSEQDAAVDPTLSGNRTYVEVFARDQFGNPVGGKSIDLSYAGDLDDWDYSEDFAVSDFDTSGDVWVISYEPGTITVTGTWIAAQTTVFSDTSGTTTVGAADATGSFDADYYGLKFSGSTFKLKSSASGTAAVGSSVTQTVKVTDQMGNPVRGYQVQFFRYGPDGKSGEPRATVQTNARGEAKYTFIGTAKGKAKIIANISDGANTRTVTGTVRFGAAVRVKVSGASVGNSDVVTVRAGAVASGVKAVLYRVDGASRKAVGSVKLDKTGRGKVSVKDRNGKAKTSYLVVVKGTAATAQATSKVVKIK